MVQLAISQTSIPALVARWKHLFGQMLNETLPDTILRPMAAEMGQIEALVAATPATGLAAIYPKLWLALETDDIPTESAAYALIVSALADMADAPIEPIHGLIPAAVPILA